MKKQNLAKLKINELLDRTLSKNGWEQEQARRVLRLRERDKVFSELNQWLSKQTYPRARLEAMWLHEAFEKRADSLVNDLIAAKDSRLRAAASRALAHPD